MRTVEHLLEERGYTLQQLATAVHLPVRRLEAICDGRWTPSPEDRQQIAAALGVSVEDISWGHSMNPRNIRYRRHGLPEVF